MPRIFISYRRADSSGHAGRIYDHLSRRVAADDLFIDVDSIAAGVDVAQRIEEVIGSCDALIALIGDNWLDAVDSAGRAGRPGEGPAVSAGARISGLAS